jgi:hypothetical protein
MEADHAELNTANPNLIQERQQAQALIDILPAEKLTAVRSLLEVMVEPLARGEGIPHEEILREFGLQ